MSAQQEEAVKQLFQHVHQNDHIAVLDGILDLVNEFGPDWVQEHVYCGVRGDELKRFLMEYFSLEDDRATERVAAFLKYAIGKLQYLDVKDFRQKYTTENEKRVQSETMPRGAWFWIGLFLEMRCNVEDWRQI